jgi:dipeptidyl aminopeptidase/acylaminoacyl peptidase
MSHLQHSDHAPRSRWYSPGRKDGSDRSGQPTTRRRPRRVVRAVIIGRMATFPELLQTKSALLADVDRDPRAPERLLVRSDLTGTMQLYELSPPEGLRQITALDEPVGNAFYVPGSRRAALEVDRGGDERHQLYVVDLEDTTRRGPAGSEDLKALTDDPAHGHHICGISPNGAVVAYLSNKHNGVDFDLWMCELKTGGHRLAYAANSWLQPASGFSPDGRWISVLRPGPRPLDTDLLLVDTATFEARVVLEHPDEGAQVGAPAWSTPTVLYVSSNVGRDHAGVVRYDLETGAASALEGYGDAWDAEPVTSSDGSTLAVVENRDGASAISVTYTSRPKEMNEIPLYEPGVVTSHLIRMPILSADGTYLYYTLSSPRLAGDVWAADTKTGSSRRLTVSPAPVGADALVGAGTAYLESFDGERVALLTYRPKSSRPAPRSHLSSS